MIVTFMEEYIGFALYWVIIAAWRAIPLIGIVLFANWSLKGRLPARFQCLLWLLVVVRLGVAITFPGALSVHGPIDRAAERLLVGEPVNSHGATVVFNAEGHSFDNTVSEAVASDHVAATHPNPVFQSAVNGNDRAIVAPPAMAWDEILAYSILALWALVFIAMCLRGLVQYIRFWLSLNSCPEITQQPVVDQLLRVCDKLRCRRRPQLKETEQVSVPAVFGLWQPVICLPVGMLDEVDDNELRLIFRHEIAHVVRYDAIVLSLSGVVRAAQWFNPFAWLVHSQLRNSVERAADERALRGENRSTLRQYGELLLKFGTDTRQTSRPATVGLLFVSAKRRLTDRIAGLEQIESSHSMLSRLLGMTLAVALICTGLFDGANAEDDTTDEKTWVVDEPLRSQLPQLGMAAVASAEQNEPKTVRTYDVSAAVATLRDRVKGTEEQIKQHVALHFIHDGQIPTIVDGKLTLIQTEEAHRNTESMLKAIARSGTPQIVIECRTIEANLDVAEDFDWILPNGLEFPGNVNSTRAYIEAPKTEFPEFPEFGSSDAGIQVITTDRNMSLRPSIRMKISDFQKRLLLRRCGRSPNSNILTAPRVTMFNGQNAAITDITQRPFVVGLEKKKEGGKVGLQPVIRIIDEGWKMHVSPVATEDGGVELKCVITESSLLDVEVVDLPVPEDLPNSDRVTLQVPTVRERSIKSVVQLAKNESLLVASPEPHAVDQQVKESMARFYLLTPSVIPDSELIELTGTGGIETMPVSDE